MNKENFNNLKKEIDNLYYMIKTLEPIDDVNNLNEVNQKLNSIMEIIELINCILDEVNYDISL